MIGKHVVDTQSWLRVRFVARTTRPIRIQLLTRSPITYYYMVHVISRGLDSRRCGLVLGVTRVVVDRRHQLPQLTIRQPAKDLRPRLGNQRGPTLP